MRMKVWTLSPPPGDRCWWSPTVWRKVSSVESVTSCRTLLLSLCMSFSPCLWSVSRCTSLEKRSMFRLSCHCWWFFFLQEPLLHGAGVVAATRRSFLPEAEGLDSQTPETANGVFAVYDPVSVSCPSQPPQPTCRHALLSLQPAHRAELRRGGDGDGIVLQETQRLGLVFHKFKTLQDAEPEAG